MPKPKPPVFHIPIGLQRHNGKVALCHDLSKPALRAWFDAVLKPTVAEWMDTVMTHPATLAAGACVIVGHNKTRYFDLASHTIIESPTPTGAWKPSTTSDPPDIDGRAA
jgi:hypothetical protein